MQKVMISAIMCLSLFMIGCGVSQDEYDQKVQALKEANNTINKLKQDLSSTKVELESVRKEKSDLRKKSRP